MDTVTAVEDDLMFRGRILRREWKRGKPVSHPCIIMGHLSPLVDLQ